MKRYWSLLLLLPIFFFLRAYKLNTDLLFHRDQGLHSQAIWQIWHEKDFSLLGHPSDVDGLIHAPIYYWLMLPSYALSGGDPVAASLFQIGLETFSIIFFYFSVKRIFNFTTANYALLLYTFSYSLVSYSRWLVNVTPILPFVNFLIFLYSKKNRSNAYSFLTGILIGSMAQFNAAIGTFLLPFNLWFYRQKISYFIFNLIGFFLPSIPLVLFDVRHQFVITSAVLRFIKGGDGLGESFTLINNLKVLLTEVIHALNLSHPLLVVIVFIISLFAIHKKQSFLLLYLLLPVLGLSFFKRGALSFFFVPLLPLTLVFIANLLSKLKFIGFILLTIFTVSNLILLSKIYTPTNALIPIGDSNLITISDRQKTIDWLYQKAEGKPFSVWFYNLPYFQDDAWNYLLIWYANKKYGYLPERTASFSKGDLAESKYFFAVFEPDYDKPSRQKDWFDTIYKEFGLPKSQFQTHDLSAWVIPI